MILSARTPAGTVDVDRVMSELSIMTTLAIVVNNVFCTPKECLVPLVLGQLELQKRLVSETHRGFRPITPQHRGSQTPAVESSTEIQCDKKEWEHYNWQLLHFSETIRKPVGDMVESSDSDGSKSSSSSSSTSSDSYTQEVEPSKRLSEIPGRMVFASFDTALRHTTGG